MQKGNCVVLLRNLAVIYIQSTRNFYIIDVCSVLSLIIQLSHTCLSWPLARTINL